MPVITGIPVGPGTGTLYISMQMHYDNYHRESGLIDNSGIRVFMTTQLRPYDMGTFTMGSRIKLLSIPPKQSSYEVVTHCPPQPTANCPLCELTQWKEFTDGTNLTVFS